MPEQTLLASLHRRLAWLSAIANSMFQAFVASLVFAFIGIMSCLFSLCLPPTALRGCLNVTIGCAAAIVLSAIWMFIVGIYTITMRDRRPNYFRHPDEMKYRGFDKDVMRVFKFVNGWPIASEDFYLTINLTDMSHKKLSPQLPKREEAYLGYDHNGRVVHHSFGSSYYEQATHS
jgi:hypothetical protein